MIQPQVYLGQPIRSLQTMLRVIAHTDVQIPRVVPDGIYGVNTQAAVRAFQRQYGLQETGQTDNATWNQIVAVFTERSPAVLPAEPVRLRWTPNRILAAGSRNTHLFMIQAMLQALGQYYKNAPALAVTGVHDEPSVAAVRWLQEMASLPQTGELDQTTWAYLVGLYVLTTGDGETAQ